MFLTVKFVTNLPHYKEVSSGRSVCCYCYTSYKMCGPVAQWIRHLTTNQGIPGSSPGGVDYLFCLILFFNIQSNDQCILYRVVRKIRIT